MYEKKLITDEAKRICEILQLPVDSCQQYSETRLLCMVTEDWLKNVYRGQVTKLSWPGKMDTCQAERILSRSCEKVPHPWVKITVKIISKSNELFESLSGGHLDRLWSSGSLYEFMSHITKENVSNLWVQAFNTLSSSSEQRSTSNNGVTFTSIVQQLLRRLNPAVYLNLQEEKHDDSTDPTLPIPSRTINDNIDHFLGIPDNPGSSNSSTSSSRSSSFYSTIDFPSCQGLIPLDAVIETEDCFLIVQPFYPYTLKDIVAFSPAVMESSHAKPLFIIYQLLHAMQALHSHGLSMGDVNISDLVLDKNMWLRLTCPRVRTLRKKILNSGSPDSDSASLYLTANSPDFLHTRQSIPSFHRSISTLSTQGANSEQYFQIACEFLKSQMYAQFELSQLDLIVENWIHRRLTNFQYLMILNHLSGRRMGDPNNHPVLPWVLDFSAPDSGYRDLTKTKFRLNKGDGQLDFTYIGMKEISDSGDHVPHHISDILSDITYYVYKARRTPKSILCAHVRSNWVPHEYPISMQRLQDWTPDECIPEFFVDPTIFDSIHEDLPDLEIPAWSKNTLDFVVRHLSALESDHVSAHLHHWIDLTFGYKLSGVSAIRAKNVHLHLVDEHTYLTSHGAVQLFQQPHPQRASPLTMSSPNVPRITRGLLNSQLLTYGLPEYELESTSDDSSSETSEQSRINQSSIHLPRNYNPLAELEHCETFHDFKIKAMHVTSGGASAVRPNPPPRFQATGATEDMVTLLCLICEMFHDAQLRMLDTRPPLWKRFKTLQKICSPDFSQVQRSLQKFVSDMFESLTLTPDKKFVFPPIMPDGCPPPTPTFLLQPYSDLIPFPAYFSELYNALSKIEEKDRLIEMLRWSKKPIMEKANLIKQMEREKIPLLEKFLWTHQGYLGSEGMALVLPYIQDVLQNEFTTVQAAWSLFDITARELGHAESAKQFLPSLTSLFSGETSSAKHIKLYHRSFLIQLILRLGLKTFLSSFSTLLVEAVAGYKDFSLTSRFYPEELLEDFNPDTILKSPQSRDPMAWPDLDPDTTDGFVDDELGGAEDLLNDDDDDDENEDNDMGDSIVDRMSLDGAHVSLRDDEDDADDEETLTRNRRVTGEEGDSIESDTSEDKIEGESDLEERSRKRRTVMFKDQAAASADQHSIHSISMLMPKGVSDSPAAGDAIEIKEETSAEVFAAENDSYFDSRDERASTSSAEQEKDDKSTEGKERLSRMSTDMQNKSLQKTPKTDNLSGVKERDVEQEADQQGNNSSNGNVMSPDLSQEMRKDSRSSVSSMSQGDGKSTDDSDANRNSSVSEDVITDDETDGGKPPRKRVMSDMVRSETEDLMMNLSTDGSGAVINIRDIAADSVKWLSHKLGPVLATKFLSRNLVRMLALCYLGSEQLQFLDDSEPCTLKSSRLVTGDKNAQKVLECIGFTILLYGEQVVLIQFFPSITDMITMAQRRLSARLEGSLIASLVLTTYVIPYLSDTTLMNVLEESLIKNCINPILAIITNQKLSFPGGALARFVMCHKLVDLLYVLGLRLGFEMTRNYLNGPMIRLFDTFSNVHGQTFSVPANVPVESALKAVTETGSYGSEDSYINIKMDDFTHQYRIGSPVDLRNLKSPPKRFLHARPSLSSLGNIDDREDAVDSKSGGTTIEKCAQELKSVFCPELAQACYIPLCRIFGSIHMEEHLHNDDLIRQLCAQHDTETDAVLPEEPEPTVSPLASPITDESWTPVEDVSVVGRIGSNVAMVGNRIQLTDTTPTTPTPEVGQFGRGYKHSGILKIRPEDLRLTEMDQNQSRHLRGNWLAYWERELGLHERDTMFNFMQIELQTYVGHTSSVRSIRAMDTENCFISASKDKTVRLWSISSCGDGMRNKQYCQFCYSRHKKSVFSVVYVDSMRLVASCDSTVHVWDPYTGVSISQLESPKYAPVVALTALPAPSTLVAMATTEATLRFLDMRTCKYTHSFKCSIGNPGLIRCMVTSPDSSWIAVGFSTGLIYILDVNSGVLLHFWKAHDGEILQLKAYNKYRLLSSSFDQTIRVWNVDTGQEVCSPKSQSEPIHCLSIYRDQLLTATTGNRVSVYSAISDASPFSRSKLQSGTFKGVLTYMSVLPLNKALLLGADNGIIRLMA